MDNAEEIFQCLDDFSKRKPKVIPNELEEYLVYVARTGDPVYQWPLLKCLFKEKLLSVITEFYESNPGLEITPSPNVDPFNYDTMKNSLIERIESFSSAPFTIQRICELLTAPRKQYNRIDKYMRAIEKNVLVVSTREPGFQRHVEQENGDATEPMVNGSDNSDYNVDVEMEDVSWKEQHENQGNHPQPGSSEEKDNDVHAKWPQNSHHINPESQDKTQYESVTPPEVNVTVDDNIPENKLDDISDTKETPTVEDKKTEDVNEPKEAITDQIDETQKTGPTHTMVIPEIIIQNAEVTEQLIEKAEKINEAVEPEEKVETSIDKQPEESDPVQENIAQHIEDTSEAEKENEVESKHISEILTSSEESSSSSDNTDGNSNSPDIHNENTMDGHEDLNHPMSSEPSKVEIISEDSNIEPPSMTAKVSEDEPRANNEFYTISDVKSALSPKPNEVEVLLEKPPEKKDESATEEIKTKIESPEIETSTGESVQEST